MNNEVINSKTNNIDYLIGLDPAEINFGYNMTNIKTKKIAKWGVFDIKDSTYEGMSIKLANKLDSVNLLSDDSTLIIPDKHLSAPDAVGVKHEVAVDNKIPIVDDTKKKSKATKPVDKNTKKKRKEDDNYIVDYSNKKGKNVAIVIEFQMSRNSKTVNLVGQLFMYFTIAKSRPNSMNLVKIVTFPAREKLKYYSPMPGDLPMPYERLNKLKKGHYANKQIGIEHCRRVLVQNNEPKETIEFFESCMKKDDISDCYLCIMRYAQMYLW